MILVHYIQCIKSGIFSTSGGVQYIMMHVGGGDIMSTSGDTMSSSGNIMSTSGDAQYIGGYHDACGGASW